MDQDEPKPAPESQEDQNVIAEYYEGVQRIELDSAEGRIRKARNAIFAIAIIQLISELIGFSMTNTFTLSALLVSLGIAAIFVGLAFLTKKQPLTAILIALGLFLGLWTFAIIVVGPEQLYRGILVRGIILYFLITGIKHAREAERIRRQMNISR
jgi:hypothetical protein